jgi:hypothetical protein
LRLHRQRQLIELEDRLNDVVEQLQEMCDVLRPMIDAARRQPEAMEVAISDLQQTL